MPKIQRKAYFYMFNIKKWKQETNKKFWECLLCDAVRCVLEWRMDKQDT